MDFSICLAVNVLSGKPRTIGIVVDGHAFYLYD